MGIEAILARLCNEKAVYWGNPVNDGTGSFTYNPPLEIDCRWEDSNEVTTDKDGNQFISRAVIYLTQDVDEQGMICLNSLENLDSSLDSDPKSVPGAFIIKRFDKSPDLRGTGFLRKAYLSI
jgi:hypothetical protein